jgi:hypothetical protein
MRRLNLLWYGENGGEINTIDIKICKIYTNDSGLKEKITKEDKLIWRVKNGMGRF